MQYCKCVHAYMCTCVWADVSQVPEITFKWNFTGLRPVKLQKGHSCSTDTPTWTDTTT